MFDYKKLKKAIDSLTKIELELYLEVEKNWNILIEVLTSDVNKTIDYFDNKCTVEELLKINSIFDDIIRKTQSKELLAAEYRLIEKYKDKPEIQNYRIKEQMIYAEQALDNKNR